MSVLKDVGPSVGKREGATATWPKTRTENMLDQSNYQRMIIDRRGNGVVVVTLNRPEKSNAIDTRMHHE